MNDDTTYTDLYSDVIPSVVSVHVSVDADRASSVGAGSGFVYDEAGHVITNQHVVAPPARGPRGRRRSANRREARAVELRFSRGDWRTGEVVGTDVHTDLAVIHVADPPAYAKPLPIATASPDQGERVAALGNPLGLDGSITAGIVSGANRSMPTGGGFVLPDTVQTDAPINPGNSGGPLVTLDGEVVGVNRARQGDNIGFAVSPEIVSRIVPSLITNGEHRHPYLQVSTLDVSPLVAEANGLDESRGILAVEVRLGPSSGALRESTGTIDVQGREVPVGGDIIVGIDGERVDSHEELMRYLVLERSPGDGVELTILRDGREQTVEVELAERPVPGGEIPIR